MYPDPWPETLSNWHDYEFNAAFLSQISNSLFRGVMKYNEEAPNQLAVDPEMFGGGGGGGGDEWNLSSRYRVRGTIVEYVVLRLQDTNITACEDDI